MKLRSTILIAALFLLFFLQVTYTYAYTQDEILPVNKIHKGMKGVGKTVISGVTVEEFDVEILGILKNATQDLILVKVSGPVIDAAGGIAAGMSGSPVYIDGKLIGAIGYGWTLTDHRVGLVTPIESMLKILNLNNLSKEYRKTSGFTSISSPGVKGIEKKFHFSEPLIINNNFIDSLILCDSFKKARELKDDNTLTAYPVKTPLFVSGLRGRALNRLMEDLKGFELFPVVAGNGLMSNSKDLELVPGSAIAVQLVRGDVDISSIGTLTYRDGENLLAFGHPFLNLGNIEYFLSSAEILSVIDNLDMPFKLGVPALLKGTITQDRNAGLGGKVGLMPKIVLVNITVEDFDLQKKEEFQFQVIRNEQMVVSLVSSSLLQCIDTAIDRQGYGTSKLSLDIIADKLSDRLFHYENMYYGEDIAVQSLADVYNILEIFSANPFDSVSLVSIDIYLQVEQVKQIALIEEVKLLNDELYPGAKAQVEVTLRPYRGKTFKQVYEIEIPENIQTGPASLTVYGGIYGVYQVEEDYESEEEENTNFIRGEYYTGLEEILEDYNKQPKNNDLVIEIMPYYVEVTEEASDTESLEEGETVGSNAEKGGDSVSDSADLVNKKNKDKKEKTEESLEKESSTEENAGTVRDFFRTDYILDGSLTLEINISSVGQKTEANEEIDEVQVEEQDNQEGNTPAISTKTKHI